ncbi:uncharacterized protein LOC104585220 [Brachypodium distachyon]|nr:uncharacterized protein LOC104585220 [Brachypodium distachyon]XP_024318925.1 uncharacterized protein LOC104585220 [Brachypodium distachyon]XP_024318926.1 uncharacterized protein LOC104585220 [Brachypodium distachyon]|eukprot:XP_014758090.1 uncharacterized protein LOC104585220 [Brachypodium distachyon]
MGWVDLWRGIIFCDLLREPLTLRSIPLPLPMTQIIGRTHLGRGMNSRGIGFVNGAGAGCLKFVELQLDAVDVSDETGFPILLVKGWSVTTWSNAGMSSRYEDWQEDLPTPVQAYQIIPDDSAVFSHSQQQQKLGTGLRLVLPAQGGGYCCEKAATTTTHSLQKLLVSDPCASLDGDDVVYLIARPKLYYPKTWILALDMKKKMLQAVVPFGILEEPDPNVIYCTSTLQH